MRCNEYLNNTEFGEEKILRPRKRVEYRFSLPLGEKRQVYSTGKGRDTE